MTSARNSSQEEEHFWRPERVHSLVEEEIERLKSEDGDAVKKDWDKDEIVSTLEKRLETLMGEHTTKVRDVIINEFLQPSMREQGKFILKQLEDSAIRLDMADK